MTDLSPEEQDLLLQMTLEAGLPPEATEHFRGTFAFSAALMNYRLKKLVKEAIAKFGHERCN